MRCGRTARGFMRAIVAIGFAVFVAGALPPFFLPPANSQLLDGKTVTLQRFRADPATTDCDRYVNSGKTYDNPDLAIQACESAVRAYPNSIRLIYNLGSAYHTKRDYSSALVLFRKAAAQGYAPAKNSLGLLYGNGQGVPQNHAESFKWYREAAGQGFAPAQITLANMYVYSVGGVPPQNYAEAVKWLRKAADQGEGRAQLFLGEMYREGKGVSQNYVQAHMWYNLAASRLTPATSRRDTTTILREAAVTIRNRLGSQMDQAQIAEAQRLAQVCIQNNYKDCGVDRPRIARRDEAAPPPAKREVASTGTGFFVSESGHILKNAHVVEHCLRVRSSLGGLISKVSIDEQSDLALYIASEKPKAFARLRGGHGAKAGEPVVAIGFPLSGLLTSDPVVTTGIISALSGLRNDRRRIQITAPVQPGNSGGPLLGDKIGRAHV